MATLGHRVGSSRPRVAPSGRHATSSRGSNGDARRDTSSLASLTPRLACASPLESATRRRRVSLRSSARPLVSPRLSLRRVSFVAFCASQLPVTSLNSRLPCRVDKDEAEMKSARSPQEADPPCIVIANIPRDKRSRRSRVRCRVRSRSNPSSSCSCANASGQKVDCGGMRRRSFASEGSPSEVSREAVARGRARLRAL